MKDILQLIKKENNQEYKDIYPKTFTDAVLDKHTGANLADILNSFNMYFIAYAGSKEVTRILVPTNLRRKGLWITYIMLDDTIVTEYYNGSLLTDDAWLNSANWVNSMQPFDKFSKKNMTCRFDNFTDKSTSSKLMTVKQGGEIVFSTTDNRFYYLHRDVLYAYWEVKGKPSNTEFQYKDSVYTDKLFLCKDRAYVMYNGTLVDIARFTIDKELSLTSNNPIANSTVTKKINEVNADATTALTLARELKEEGRFLINGNVTNNPDEEDITVEENKLKFKDKVYNAGEFSGLGRVYLRKNIVNGKNVLTQEMINKPNTIYIIQYDYDLDNEEINVLENCTLQFEGGSFKNGTLNNIKHIIADKDSVIFKSINVNGLMTAYTKWFDILPNLNISKADNIQRLLDMNIATILFNDGVYYIDKPLQPRTNQTINLEGTNPKLNKNTDYWYNNFDGKGVVLAPKEGVGAFIINCYCNIIGGVIDYNFKHNFRIDSGCQQTAIFIDYANVNIKGTHISCAIHDYYKDSVNKNHNSIGIRIGSSNNNVKGNAFNIYINSDIKHFGIGYQIDKWVINDLDVNLWCTSTYYNGCIWNCKRALDIKGGQGSFFKGMIQSKLTDFSDNKLVNIESTQIVLDMYIWDFNQSHGNNRYIYINKNLNHIANHIINEYKFKIKWIDNTILVGDNNYLYNKYFKNICGKGGLSNYTYIESNIDNILLGADKIHNVEFFKDGLKQQTKSELFSLFDYKRESWEQGEWKIKIIFANLVNLPFIAVNCNSSIINSMKLIQYYNNNQVKTSEEIMMEKIGSNVNNVGFNGYYYSRELDNSRNTYYNDIKDVYNNSPHTEAIEFVFNLTEKNNIDIISLFIAKDLNNKNSNYFVSPFKDNVLYSNYSFEQNWNNKETYDNKGINSIRIPTIKWVPQPTDKNNGILICRYEENNGSFLESILYNKNNELINQRLVSYTPTYRYGDAHFQNLAKKSLTINDIGYSFFNTTLNKEFIWNGTDFINNDGTNINILKKGTTAQRPTGVQIGFTYKDTDLNKWIIWNGEAWENIDGTALG